jgi:hypothetical protein
MAESPGDVKPNPTVPEYLWEMECVEIVQVFVVLLILGKIGAFYTGRQGFCQYQFSNSYSKM